MEPRWCSARRWSLGSGGLMPATVSIMPTFEELDAITLADLQATGATKWSRGSDLIGAFVAEMDFGIAAPITRRLHREVDRAAFGYLPRDLKAEMREATTAFLRERTGWEVDPRDVHEMRSEEHTSELQSRGHLVCRLLLEKKKETSQYEIYVQG